MVVFTCSNCGESLKKPSVAKHYMGRCRGPPSVTCVDCFKDFLGNDYEAHTKCITEEERYSAKGFVPKPTSNKGEKKQQSWCETIQTILNTNQYLKVDERSLLTQLSTQENVPRKRGKFVNFITNAHRSYAKRQDLIERVWTIIEEANKAGTAQEPAKAEEPTDANTEEATPNGEPEKRSKKKRNHAENGDDLTPSETNGTEDVSERKSKKAKMEKEEPAKAEEPTDANTEDATPNGEPEKRSKKKRKHAENGDDLTPSETNGIEDVSERKSKKSKMDKEEKTNSSKMNGELTEEPNTAEVSTSIEKNGIELKSRKSKASKEREANGIEENGKHTEEAAAPEVNKSSKKKRKSKSGEAVNDFPKEENVDEAVYDTEKACKKKKKDVLETSVNGVPDNGKQSDNLLINLLQKADGNTTLHKLLQSISEHFKTEVGEEKAEKKVKKILKQTVVSLKGDVVSLAYSSS